MPSPDHYSTLGVGKAATPAEIKRAYRKLARKYPPDVSTEADAEGKFKDLNAANEALSAAPGCQSRLKGRGSPGQPPGHLYAVLTVGWPPADTPAARQACQTLGAAFPDYPARPARL